MTDLPLDPPDDGDRPTNSCGHARPDATCDECRDEEEYQRAVMAAQRAGEPLDD